MTLRSIRPPAGQASPQKVSKWGDQRFAPCLLASLLPRWIIPVQLPLQRVIGNIPANSVQLALVADDVLIETALPQRPAGGLSFPVETPRRHRLEIARDGP
jgi:hypothetical protein